MEEKRWLNPALPHNEIVTVTLGDKEIHEWFMGGTKNPFYTSYGKGHVFIDIDDHGMTRWTEYDLNDERFLNVLKQLKQKGWLEIPFTEEEIEKRKRIHEEARKRRFE
jgi:hypothetical protein